MSLITKVENWLSKVEAWLKKESAVAIADIDKAAVFIVAKLDPEIEALIASGTIIAIEKVVDVVTQSNVGDVAGAAIIKEWPKIVQVAEDVHKAASNFPMLKTMLAAQIKGILNSELKNPGVPKLQNWIKDVELAFQDLEADVKSLN